MKKTKSKRPKGVKKLKKTVPPKETSPSMSDRSNDSGKEVMFSGNKSFFVRAVLRLKDHEHD